jgi:hypothetical protein
VVNRAAGTAGDDAVEAAVRTLRAGADTEVVATGSAAELDAAVGFGLCVVIVVVLVFC